MYKIGICDDEEKQRNVVREMLAKLSFESGLEFQIETFSSGEELIRHYEQIIFLTNYPEYMMDSFDVMTYQYLLKPVDPAVFNEKITRLCAYLNSLEKKFIIIKSGLEEILLKHDDIIAIEVAKSLTVKNKLKIITTEYVYETKGTISKYAQMLSGYTFLQIHRSIIINFVHVKKFCGSHVRMLSGSEFPIGRSKIKEVKDLYTKFMITEGD